MNGPLGVDFTGLNTFSNSAQTFSDFFNPENLLNSAPNCSIIVNTNALAAYSSNQESIDLLGDLMSVESEKLGNISTSFQYLEDTLSTLYNG